MESVPQATVRHTYTIQRHAAISICVPTDYRWRKVQISLDSGEKVLKHVETVWILWPCLHLVLTCIWGVLIKSRQPWHTLHLSICLDSKVSRGPLVVRFHYCHLELGIGSQSSCHTPVSEVVGGRSSCRTNGGGWSTRQVLHDNIISCYVLVGDAPRHIYLEGVLKWLELENISEAVCSCTDPPIQHGQKSN